MDLTPTAKLLPPPPKLCQFMVLSEDTVKAPHFLTLKSALSIISFLCAFVKLTCECAISPEFAFLCN